MKNIITKLTQAGGVLVLALVLGIGASVFAVNYAGPTSTPPGNNAPVPVNVESSTQDKIGNLGLANGLRVLGLTSIGNFLSGEKLEVRAPAFFSNNGTTNNAQVKIGGTATTTTRDGGRIPPFTVDIANRSGWDGHDFLHVQTNQSNISSTGDTANASTNASIFGFWSDKNSRYADIWAGLPRFSRGSPSSGKILAAYNTDGDANWGTISGSGGGLDLATVRTTCHAGGSNSTTCGYEWGGTSAGYIGVSATAWCPSGYYEISGGGHCQNSRTQLRGHISQPVIGSGAASDDGTFYYNTSSWSNADQPAGWRVSCGPGYAHAQVICAKTIPATVTVAVTAPPAPTPPPTPVKSWKSLGSLIGNPGQTCLSAAGVSVASDIRLKKNDNGSISYVTNGNCYYESVNSTQSNPIINSFSVSYSNSMWYPVGAVQNLAPDGYDYTLEAFKY